MHRYLAYVAGVVLVLITASAFAATVDIYEKPDEHSKVIATMKTGDQLMPIFYTEKKDWVKVANPKNGDVGWAKADKLKGPIIVTNLNGTTVRQQIIADDTDKGPKVYSIIQYGGQKELKPEEAQEIAKKMEKRQREMEASMQQMQKNMQQMMQNLFKTFDRILYNLPMVVMPDGSSPLETTTEKEKK